MENAFRSFCILHFAFCIGSCSIPNLEPQPCIDARTPVREFYSFHFGNDMNFSQEGLSKREQFLTREFIGRLASRSDGPDLFTTGDMDFPKAFRVGECREIAANKTEFQVLLFWKDDVRTEQREINVVAVMQDGRWLIDDVTPARTQ